MEYDSKKYRNIDRLSYLMCLVYKINFIVHLLHRITHL